MSGGPLTGVRVVDLTTVVVGPTATLYLADFGADVIKVEAPSGDLLRTIGGRSKSGQLSGKFTHFNRNKRSLALDLKEDKARGALDRLLQTADVFIANVRPAALARLGLAAPALRARYQRLIVCNLEGFRGDGPIMAGPPTTPSSRVWPGLPPATSGRWASRASCPVLPTTWSASLRRNAFSLPSPARADRTGQAIEVPMFENMAAFVLAEHLGDRTFIPPPWESGTARTPSAGQADPD